MNSEQITKVFQELGALKNGHFQLTSGLHSGQYMQCAAVFEQPYEANKIIEQLCQSLPKDIDTVIAPAIGGIAMGYAVASKLKKRFIFAERENDKMTLRRGFNLSPQEKILIVEDVVTTGGSVQEIIEIAIENQCSIQGVAALVNRSQGKADFQVPFTALLNMDIQTYQPHECPFCKAGKPIDKPGSRKS